MLTVAWGLLLACGWALCAFFARRVVGEVGPRNVTIWVQLIGTLFLAPFTPFGAAPVATLVAAAATAISGALGLTAIYQGLRVGNTGVVLSLAACGPLVPIALATLAGEPFPVARLPAVALAFAGIVVLSTARSTGSGNGGALWGLGNLVFGGLSLYGFKLAVAWSGTTAGLWWVKAAGVVLYGGLVAVSLVRSSSFKPLAFSRGAWLGLAMAGGCDALAALSLANGYALAGGTTVVSAIGALYPCLTALLARLILGERLNHQQGIGMALALAGAVALAAS